MAQYKSAISGSSGFIGSHLVAKLESLEHKVIRLDRTGNLPEQVDYLFDLASYGNFHFQTDHVEIFNANVIRLLKLLRQVKKIKGIVLTSSSSVLLPEITFYSASKIAVETISRAFNLPIVTARPSTIIGTNEPGHHLIPTLINSCFTSKQMDFVASPIHDFLSVDDYVEAIILMAKNAKKLKHKILNVSSGKSFSNAQIKEKVERIMTTPANIRLVKNLRSYDSTKWKVKPSRELFDLGWKPKQKIDLVIQDMAHQAYLDRI
jgi:nucleoside-diphosphate-sugar epimerase